MIIQRERKLLIYRCNRQKKKSRKSQSIIVFSTPIIYSRLLSIFHINIYKKGRILKNILRGKFIVSTVSKDFPESAFRSCKLGTIRGQTLRGNSEGVTKTFQQFSEWQNENCRQRGRKQSVLRSTKVRDNNGGERGEPSSQGWTSLSLAGAVCLHVPLKNRATRNDQPPVNQICRTVAGFYNWRIKQRPEFAADPC